MLHRHYRLRGRHRLKAAPVVLRSRLGRLRGLALYRSRCLNWLTRWIKARLRHGLRTWLNACLFGLPIHRFSAGRFVGRGARNSFCFSHLDGFGNGFV